MLRQLLFSQRVQFFYALVLGCENAYWETLGLDSSERGRVTLRFVHRLVIPDAPIVGVRYSDGNWHCTPTSVEYDKEDGWKAFVTYDGSSSSLLRSDVELKQKVDTYLNNGWMHCVLRSDWKKRLDQLV